MLTRQEIKDWLLKNAVNDEGDLDLSYLDFSDFDGDVLIHNMKVKKTLNQSYQEVGDILYQEFQKVDKYLFQHNQQVGRDLLQNNQIVGESLFQSNQKVGKNFCNHKLNEDEYWEEKETYVIRRKKLKEITLEDLEKMGYKIKEEM